jgi:hypothetical protein
MKIEGRPFLSLGIGGTLYGYSNLEEKSFIQIVTGK